MRVELILNEMIKIGEMSSDDPESMHIRADRLLIELIKLLSIEHEHENMIYEILRRYMQIEKWYA